MRTLQLLAAGLVATGLGLALVASALADQPSLSITDGSADLGAQTTVSVNAGGVGEPGLGAWSVDIVYDPSILTPVSCTNGADQIAVCNPLFTDDSARISGASAAGITGSFALGTLTFECRDRGGTSPLTIRPRDFMDATPLHLRPIDAVLDHGNISCGMAALPASGTHDRPDSGALMALMGILAAAGMATVARGALLRRNA